MVVGLLAALPSHYDLLTNIRESSSPALDLRLPAAEPAWRL
jgi:hypothetical protein